MHYMALIELEENTRKKGSAELLVLAQLEGRPRHGYEIGIEIERRSEGAVSFQIASLYPVLYRLERKGLIAGRWVETAGQRRRRYYRLTPAGKKMLSEKRRSWSAFLIAVQRAAGLENA
jgi:PadR family transcriptional regulator, regulatory protein PadR